MRVEPPARVSDAAEITGSGLILGDSHIYEHAVVTDAPRIEDTYVFGYSIVTGEPYLYNSIIQEHAIVTGEPTITGSLIGGTARVNDKVQVNESTVAGNALVAHNALVQKSRILGNVVVLGGELHGVTLERSERVHEGIWYRAPRYAESSVAELSMTECVHGKIIIGCVCRSVNWWWKNADVMQQQYGWSEAAVQWVKDNIGKVSEG